MHVPTAVRALLLVAALLAVPAAPAAAHTALSSTSPADGEQLAEPPAQVELVFTDAVLDLGTQLAVSGPEGPVEVAPPVVDGERVTAALPGDLPAGSYSVLWRVTAEDGHPISGEFTFTATAGAPAPTATATPTPTADEPSTSAPAASTDAPTADSAAGGEDSVAGADDGVSALTLALLALGAVVIVAAVFAVAKRRGG